MSGKRKILLLLAVILVTVTIIFFIPENTAEARTRHFVFIYGKSIDGEKINALAAALENNYPRIGKDLNTSPADTIETHVYAQRWRYIKATGNWSASGNIEGIAKMHFVEQAWTESNTQKIAVHEFAHTVTLKLLLDREPKPLDPKSFDRRFASFPVWLWEAISCYEAGQFIDPKTLSFMQGNYPRLAELNNRSKGGKIYKVGYTLIEYILNRYGKDKLVELIASYGDLSKTLGTTVDEFSKEWYAFVEQKYF